MSWQAGGMCWARLGGGSAGHACCGQSPAAAQGGCERCAQPRGSTPAPAAHQRLAHVGHGLHPRPELAARAAHRPHAAAAQRGAQAQVAQQRWRQVRGQQPGVMHSLACMQAIRPAGSGRQAGRHRLAGRLPAAQRHAGQGRHLAAAGRQLVLAGQAVVARAKTAAVRAVGGVAAPSQCCPAGRSAARPA